MHPVEVPAASEADPAFGLPERPPGVVLGLGEDGSIAPPLELVAGWIVVDRNAPAVHGRLCAAAHFANHAASPPDIQPQFANGGFAIVIQYALCHALDARYYPFMTLESGDSRIEFP